MLLASFVRLVWRAGVGALFYRISMYDSDRMKPEPVSYIGLLYESKCLLLAAEMGMYTSKISYHFIVSTWYVYCLAEGAN